MNFATKWAMRIERIGLRLSRRISSLRGRWLSLRIRASGGRCGTGLHVQAGFRLVHPPHAGLRFGHAVWIGPSIVIDVPLRGLLILEDRVHLTGFTTIAAASEIKIGQGTLVGEYVSVRDANHATVSADPIASQPLVTSPIHIGENVWLGRGVAVLKGASIGPGAVIGANSVVIGEVLAQTIAVGAPARPIRSR